MVELSGYAVIDDRNLEKYYSTYIRRYDFDTNVLDYHVERFCSEILNDIFEDVKTPTPALPDYNVEENREAE